MIAWLMRVAGLVSLAVALQFAAGRAAAQYCPPSNITALSATTMNVGTYDPFSATVPRIVTITVTTTASCAISLWFFRDPITPIMTQGTSQLTYQIEQVGGGNTYVGITGFLAPAANRFDIVTVGGQTVTRTVQVRVVASQIVQSGAYSDTNVSMILASRSGGNWFLVRQTTVTPAATVASVCRLDAPSPSSLAWTAVDIPRGVPNTAVVRNSTMTAACTAPTIVRLTGRALALTPTAPAASGFSNVINYRAIGTFGAATATLNTTTTVTSASSPTRNVASGATTSGSVGVSVNLVAGGIAMAGTYTGVLTVTIDPNL